METIHTFLLEHVMAWLPGLWSYSRPVDLLAVVIGMVAFVFLVRLVATLLPVLLLAGVFLLLAHVGHSGFRGALNLPRVEMGR